MKKFNHRRLLSLVLAIVMVLGMLPTGLAVSSGDDGTPEMNEAYENRETLVPIGASFNVDTLLEWTPESDPDAAYSRASIPLAQRAEGNIHVNDLANPEAKLMLCATPTSDHDSAGAQGSDAFFTYAFNYWQYTDSFIYWSGSEEGIVCCPTGEYIDAAHTNGVPIVATLGFPWGSGYGYVEQVDRFCQKAEDGSFPVADKLIEVMDYYGFDGYFFNQESYGCSQAIAERLNEMMRYMHAKRPDMLISWYDSMISSGGVSYQDAVNSYNKSWMEPDENGIWGVDEFFMNYNWTASKIATTISTLKSIGRSQFDAFAGFNVQANVYGDRLSDHLLVDEDGLAKISLALYYANQTITMAKDGEDFHKTEQAYYVNSKGDPRDTSANLNSTAWAGMSRFFAEKTPITSAPFVTNFNTGHGKGWFVDGEKVRDTEWSYQSAQDVLPTYTWIVDTDGTQKLEGSYDFSDAYNGGSSIKFSGSTDGTNTILLYATEVEITNGMTMSLTAKGGLENASVFAYVGDGSASSYADCEKVTGTLNTGDGWVTTGFDFSPLAGLTVYGLGIQVEGGVSDYQINVGQVSIIDKSRNAVKGPSEILLEDILYKDSYTAEARVQWSKVTGASSYEIYKVNADGSKTFIMETPNTAYYIPNLVRNEGETDVTLEIVSVNRNGVRGKGTQLTIDWAYADGTTDRITTAESVNVCLGATVTGYSEQGDGAECDKALDGISGNASKWWASGRGDWFSIDLGEPKTIMRIRMEHAEAGGEGKDLNTSAYTVYYKDASGSWVTALKVTGNTDAYNDLLLDTPVTAQEWKLVIDGIGPSPWSAVNIYEWQMFETGFPCTDNVPMQFASAANGAGATDTFTLKNVPATRTVKVYTAEGALVGEKSGSGTVTLTDLDFGTAEAGYVQYTVTEEGYEESAKLAAFFDAENAAVSEPAEDVSFEAFSQPGSVSSSRFDEIYTSMTVKGLAEGDVVYVQGRASMAVAAGETSVTVDRVLVKRAGGEIALQVKRAGKLISAAYNVTTPEFDEPTATVQVFAENENGETLTGVRFELVDEDGNVAAQMSTTSDSGAKAEVALGTYTIRNTEAPEGYGLADGFQAILRIEGWLNTYTVTLSSGTVEPEPDPEPSVPTDPTEPPVVVDPADDSRDIPLEILTVSTGNYEPNGGSSEGPAYLAVDNDHGTIWHTDWAGTSRDDHWFQFEIDGDYLVDGLRILPRQTGNTNGIITAYEIQVSEDGENFVSIATGTWEADREWKLAQFDASRVKYVRMYALDGVTDNAYVFASAAEIRLTGEEYVEPVEENLALNAEIIAYNGTKLGDPEAGPEKLFDGAMSDEATDKWCEDGKNLWVAFDLGTYADVNTITLYHAGANNEWMPAGSSTNTEAYELYVLNTDMISYEELMAKSFDERTDLLENSAYWLLVDQVSGNTDDVTTHQVDLTAVRVFKFNVSDTDSTSWAACVRVYELEVMGYAGKAPVIPEIPTYTITIAESVGGTVTANAAEAEAGDIIRLTVTPDEGYELVAIYINGVANDDLDFTMPESDVTITAEFALIDDGEDEDAIKAAQEAVAAAEAAQAAAEEAQRKAEEAQAAAEEAAKAAGEDQTAAEAARKEAEDALAAAEAAQAAAEEATEAAEAAQAAAEAHDAAAAEAAAAAAASAQEAAEMHRQIAEMKAEMAQYLLEAAQAAAEAEENSKAAVAAALAAEKYKALVKLAVYVDPDDYDAKTANQIRFAVSAGIDAIENAETIEAVREALAEALKQINLLIYTNPFADVAEDAFYAESVLWAYASGITNGTSENTFSPEKTITRAEAITFLWRAAGEPEPAASENPFVDVTENDFFYKAVLWAVEKGIASGMDLSHFAPYATASRAHVVTFLWRANGAPAASVENPFTDVAENAWFCDAVLWALENGITTGATETFFNAWGTCNRAQVVTFLYRAAN